MRESQVMKIRHFLSDKEMCETVRSVLISSFMKKREADVQYLAAQTLAYQMLEDGWHELLSYRPKQKKPEKAAQIGL